MDSYSLSRNFWDWAFENPEKVSPNHAAIYFFAIEHCNRLGWKKKFGFPSQMTMEAIGIKKHSTYIKYFQELVEWGFFVLVEKSKNQYSANIISLNDAMPKNGKALDKANVKHRAKQTESMGQSTGSINKQDTSILINNIPFETFWNLYPVKVGKAKCQAKWEKIPYQEQCVIIEHLPEWSKYKPFESYNHPNPETYLNQKRWQDPLPQKDVTYTWIKRNHLGPLKRTGNRAELDNDIAKSKEYGTFTISEINPAL